LASSLWHPGPQHANPLCSCGGSYHTDRQPGAALQNTAICPGRANRPRLCGPPRPSQPWGAGDRARRPATNSLPRPVRRGGCRHHRPAGHRHLPRHRVKDPGKLPSMGEYFDPATVVRAALEWAIATRVQLARWEPLVADRLREESYKIAFPAGGYWQAHCEWHFCLIAARNLIRALDLLDPPLTIDQVLRQEITGGRCCVGRSQGQAG
jgi:hypothetical protein